MALGGKQPLDTSQTLRRVSPVGGRPAVSINRRAAPAHQSITVCNRFSPCEPKGDPDTHRP